MLEKLRWKFGVWWRKQMYCSRCGEKLSQLSFWLYNSHEYDCWFKAFEQELFDD